MINRKLVIGGVCVLIALIAVVDLSDHKPAPPKTLTAPTVEDSVPEGFTGKPDSFSGIILRWKTSNNPHQLGYAVDRSTDGRHFDRYVAITVGRGQMFGDEFVFSDNNVTKGDSYWYRVREIKTVGQGQPTKILKVTA